MELQDKEIKVEIKLVPETMVVEEEEQVPQELMQLPLVLQVGLVSVIVLLVLQ